MKAFKSKGHRIHFVGIGGIGMSGIAEVLLELGYHVSGSDLRESETTRRLASRGGRIHVGHSAEHVGDADVVVISSAVRRDNPEVAAAASRAIPVIPRAEMLGELMRLKEGIAIAGSHGKTTTTSMLAALLDRGGVDPTVVIGGKVNSLGSNAKLGAGEFLVAEADESDGSFLKLSPTIAVVTNIDPEHMDHYRDLDDLKQTFLSFINKVPFYGLSVLCLDCPNVQSLIPQVEKRYLTYGTSSQADYSLTDVKLHGLTTTFRPVRHGEVGEPITLQMVGEHYALNAVAAIAVADELELPAAGSRDALREFGGVQRRFTVRGEVGGVMVVDDYGHHPTEIRATLRAAREGFGRRIVAVFQPHRYSRAAQLFEQFATAFYDADLVLATEIYAAGEPALEGITGDALATAMKNHGHRDVTFCPDHDALLATLRERVAKGDLVITLGAGDIWRTGQALLDAL